MARLFSFVVILAGLAFCARAEDLPDNVKTLPQMQRQAWKRAVDDLRAKLFEEPSGVVSPLPVDVQDYLDRSKAAFAKRIEERESTLRNQRRTPALRKYAKETEAELDLLRGEDRAAQIAVRRPLYPVDIHRIEIGQIGTMPGNVRQVGEKRSVIAEYRWDHTPIWIDGLDTKDLVDGSPLPKGLVYRFTGTISYTGVSGAKNTILRAEVLDVGPFLKIPTYEAVNKTLDKAGMPAEKLSATLDAWRKAKSDPTEELLKLFK